MSIGTRIPADHVQVEFQQGTVMRQPSPDFSPPVLTGMREPGTNYITIVTAPGPHNVQNPGVTGGIVPGANNRKQTPVPPLTRKGG
jgi:hypothetical protein